MEIPTSIDSETIPSTEGAQASKEVEAATTIEAVDPSLDSIVSADAQHMRPAEELGTPTSVIPLTKIASLPAIQQDSSTELADAQLIQDMEQAIVGLVPDKDPVLVQGGKRKRPKRTFREGKHMRNMC